MIIRCKSCHGSIWVQSEDSSDAVETNCRRCGAGHESARSLRYDPAFQQAVGAGWLTARQARERGSREVYASMLRARHQLSPELAGGVADNRISLLEAIRERETAAQSTWRGTPPSRRIALLVGVLVLVAIVVMATRPKATTVSEAAVARIESSGSAKLRTDSRGRVVQVLGPSPRAVLEAFCEAGGVRSRLEPLDLAPSSLPGPRSRLGLLRDRSHPDTLLAITIREDRQAGHWIAGADGELLIPAPAPDGAERTLLRK